MAEWGETLDGEPIHNYYEHAAYWNYINGELRRHVFNMDKIVNRAKLRMMF